MELAPQVLITGGNGFIGSETVRELIRKGYRVKCLLREESNYRRIADLNFGIVRGDVRDLNSLREAARDCVGIFHLAGISSWQQIREQANHLENIIVGGTENILKVALELKIKRTLIVSSSAAINGTRTPFLCNEQSKYELETSHLLYSRAKWGLEQVVHRYHHDFGLDVVIVNPCETYGASDQDLVTAGNLLEFLHDFPALVCKGGTAVAHVEDVAHGIVLGFEKGRSGERYILGGDNLTLSELAKVVRKIANKSSTVITLPTAWVRAIIWFLTKLGLPAPVPQDVFEYASLYWFVDSTKAVRDLGYHFRPAPDVFKEVVPWLMAKSQKRKGFSFRYGGGKFDLRSNLIRFFGFLQKKKLFILNSDPKLCGEILAASDTKGTFLEQLIATPAWHPVYSIESMDGERWKQLAQDFKSVLAKLDWRRRLPKIIEVHLNDLKLRMQANKNGVVDSEEISKLTGRILFELLFDHPMSISDEDLFYSASVEWKKEIAVKGKANAEIKEKFWDRLQALVAQSQFKEGLLSYSQDPSSWLSVFAQPFLISPQINIGDIFVSVFYFLKRDSFEWVRAKEWARTGDRPHLDGIILESIRLKHPFPILEREMKNDFHSQGHHYPAGSQIFILLDQFKQDETFKPERWLESAGKNPYSAIPFAAGPRMCVGKPIAMELLSSLLSSFLRDFSESQIQPEVGHQWSGRDNDDSSLRESWYQLKIFAGAMKRSLSLRPVSACPWKKITHSVRNTLKDL